ncbi:hypothetical protein EV702DRAFT_1136357 [Suillus placidus]|uniref:Uncharacterized protein n=1 Tax=Suillus placidus TaxID=48579 RepID=A0A9P6ZLU1_9AGAM|nr:hypothetical protein EV702DRAFT_1136357 [Suillus placidus]
MLTLSRFTVALALASSIFGVTVTMSAVPSRRSGELWEGLEHEEVDLRSLAPPLRSGELWLGAEHKALDAGGLALSHRSGDLWHGSEHEEAPPSTNV